MNCFNCDMTRACKSCLDLVSQKKTYYTDSNTDNKRKPVEYYCQMLPLFIGEHEPKQNNIDFESAREILLIEYDEMVMKRRSERIYKTIECESYNKNEDFLENKLINVCTNKFINKVMEKRDFYITGWSLMILVKRKNFYKIQGICL